MATLLPYYYVKNSSVFSTGYPTKSSAMYNGKVQVEIASIFYNNSSEPIQLKSVETFFGMYISPGNAKLIFATLSGLDKNNYFSPKTVTPRFISNSFEVPITSELAKHSKTVAVSGTVVVPKYTYFIVGAKVVSASSKGWVSCARSNADSDYKRTQYYSQSLGNSLTTPDEVKLVTPSDPWNNQIPYIKVNYETYAIKPVPSKTSLTLKQGASETILVSGYDNWKIDSYDSSYLTLTKSGNKLTITAKYKGSSQTTKNIVLVGSTSSATATVAVTIIPPSFITQPTDFTLKPTQSKSLAYKFSDGKTSKAVFPQVATIGVTTTSTSISVDKIDTTPSGTDWNASAGGSALISIRIEHPNNANISKTITATIRHWSTSDIKVQFNYGTNILNKEDSRLYYIDDTSVSGKCSFSFNPSTNISFNLSGSYIYLEQDTQLNSFTTQPYLTNDCVVKGSNTIITVSSSQTFGILSPSTSVTEEAAHYLPAFYDNSISISEQNPAKLRFLNFPIYFIFPTIIPESPGSTYYITPTAADTDKWYLYYTIGSEQTGQYIQISTLIKQGTLIYPGLAYPVLLSTPDYTLTSIPESKTIKVSFELYYEDIIVTIPGQQEAPKVDIYYYLLPFTSFYTNYNHTLNPPVPMQGSLITMDSNLTNEFTNLGWAVKSLNYAYGLGLGADYITNTTPSVSDINIIVPEHSNGSYISSQNNKNSISTILSAFDNFINKLNEDCRRTFKPVRQLNDLLDFPIMWDDSLSNLADGRANPLLNSFKGRVLGNATITSADATRALQIAAGIGEPPTEYEIFSADINCDGIVSSDDALTILKMAQQGLLYKDLVTISPYKEIFNIMNNIQFESTYNVIYSPDNVNSYNVIYGTDNDNIIYRG